MGGRDGANSLEARMGRRAERGQAVCASWALQEEEGGQWARQFHSFVSFCLPPRALYRHARFPDTELPTYYKRCSYPRESVKETAFERLVILKRIAGDKAFSKQELLSRPCLP